MTADGPGGVEVATLTDEDMGVTLDLPTGWAIEADPDGDRLLVVAEDRFVDDDYAASVLVGRLTPLLDDELPGFAAAAFAQVERDRSGYALVAETTDRDRVVRTHRFDAPEAGRRVHQVQAIVDDVGCYVVTCTAALAHADELQPLFAHVVTSLRHHAD